MQITEGWISAAPAQAVCKMLTDAGHKALFVGGCVRNALLRVPVNDIDIATDALPDRVSDLAKAAGLKVIPTGIDHGTVTVVVAHYPFEITTFRRDVSTDGRRAVVDFTHDIAEDARRRDFTINALYADPTGQVIDPLAGLNDLKTRKLRFIDDADQRIREDYLRILRFFRFHAWYGDVENGLDAGALAACASNLAGLETVSKERVGAELLKLLAAKDPGQSVAAMAQSGVLNTILPGADARALPILVHAETEMGLSPSAVRRLAVLGGASVGDLLRLSRAQSQEHAKLIEAVSRSDGPAALGYRHGASFAADVLALRWAMLETPAQANWHEQIAIGTEATFPVAAADLMPRYGGAELGARLKALEAQWIASGFSIGKDVLLR